MSARSTKFEIRLTESEKARWQGEADEQQTTLSELVRSRMNDTGTVVVGTPVQASVALAPEPPESTRDPVDLDSEELRPLRSWLDLADSDGHFDPSCSPGGRHSPPRAASASLSCCSA